MNAQGDLKSEDISDFFADTIVTARKRTKTNCLSPGTSACDIQEKSTSRWEDMKLSCFLLGNAFRVDSGKPPEKVKQVKEAKVFFAEVDKLRKAADAGNKKAAAVSYAAAKEALEIFLNDVELPPTSFPDYKQTADVSVPSLCQGSFCIRSATWTTTAAAAPTTITAAAVGEERERTLRASCGPQKTRCREMRICV